MHESNEILKRRTIRVDGTWDIEASDWDNFVCGGLYLGGDYEEYWHTKEEDFAARLLSFDGVLWAHFAGGYDMKWLLDWAGKWKMRAKLVTAGSRIVTARVGKTFLCDSFALAPISLEKLTTGLGVSKMRLDLPCVCGNGCGGFCSIRRDMKGAMKRQTLEYMKFDCIALWEALSSLSAFAEEHDLDLGRTVGSSAWRHLQRVQGIQPASLSLSDYNFARRAYFGGRVQVYRRGMVPSGHAYDVNSMYPYALSTVAVPVGAHWREYGRGAREAYNSGRPGIYACNVSIPECHIPPLPLRYNGGQSVAYPWGDVQGSWALPELQHAESLGCKVTPYEGLVWEDSLRIFSEWVDKLWALRAKAAPPGHVCAPDTSTANPCKGCGKSTPMGEFLKLYLNSATGKFGSNPEQETWELNPKRIKRCTYGREGSPCTAEKCHCGAHRQVSESLFVSTTFRNPAIQSVSNCHHVEWAAYLTSFARVLLNRFQIANSGGVDMIYSDTDSAYRSTPCDMNNGDGLGQWKYEGEFQSFVAVAPKVYSYEKGGRLEARAKGLELPTRRDDRGKKIYLARPEAGQHYHKSGVIGFRAGARRGKLFQKYVLTRKLNERLGDRFLDGNNGATRAPNISELEP